MGGVGGNGVGGKGKGLSGVFINDIFVLGTRGEEQWGGYSEPQGRYKKNDLPHTDVCRGPLGMGKIGFRRATFYPPVLLIFITVYVRFLFSMMGIELLTILQM